MWVLVCFFLSIHVFVFDCVIMLQLFFSVPHAEYFTMQMYCGVTDIENWRGYRFVGNVDYSSADYISRLEIVDMAKGLQLDAEGATFWFKDILSQGIGLSEIKNDLDVNGIGCG